MEDKGEQQQEEEEEQEAAGAADVIVQTPAEPKTTSIATSTSSPSRNTEIIISTEITSTDVVQDSSSTDAKKSPFVSLASPEWCEWFGKLDDQVRAQVEASIMALDVGGVEEESDEAADRTETTVFFFLQFLVGVLVLADYMLGQEWPQGGFLCQWAYFSSVVMYKPFTVPMWFCLLLCCHYTFAERLFGGCTGGRDELTGRPLGAPFERNKLTLGLVYATAALQGVWFVAASVVAVPLAFVFAHVVVLVAFGLPFGATFATQKALGPLEEWWRARFKEGALEVVKKDGLKLEQLSRAMRGDKDVVLAAVTQN